MEEKQSTPRGGRVMDNAGQFVKEVAKGLAYMVFVYPFVWAWRGVRPDDGSGQSDDAEGDV